ncbi:hypothetical protein TNCV_534001 [Trichonephila clavipes]|nr:hypothetical protein TNCV_534001 [Trichonephila clavipes]
MPVQWLVTLISVPLALGSNPGEGMDNCKCIVPSQHRVTLNIRRAASHLMILMERGREVSSKLVDFHVAENRQRPCRVVMWHVKGPQSACLALVLSAKLKSLPNFTSLELRYLTLGKEWGTWRHCGHWSVAKSPRVAEQCDVNIPSLTRYAIRLARFKNLVDSSLVWEGGKIGETGNAIEEVVDFVRQIKLEVNSYEVKELLDSLSPTIKS